MMDPLPPLAIPSTLYAPMTFLIVSLFRSVKALNSVRTIRESIRTTREEYRGLLRGWLLILIPNTLLTVPLIFAHSVGFFGPLLYVVVTSPVYLYSGCVAFRLLGQYYYRNVRRLSWLGEIVEAAPLRRRR